VHRIAEDVPDRHTSQSLQNTLHCFDCSVCHVLDLLGRHSVCWGKDEMVPLEAVHSACKACPMVCSRGVHSPRNAPMIEIPCSRNAALTIRSPSLGFSVLGNGSSVFRSCTISLSQNELAQCFANMRTCPKASLSL
jgi:hypothetical protein